MLPISNDTKKEKLKDVLLGLHWAATTGNVGKYLLIIHKEKKKTLICNLHRPCQIRVRPWCPDRFSC